MLSVRDRRVPALVAAILLYELGRLGRTLPFEELKRRSRVNEAARAAGDAPDFSRRARAGLPRPPRVQPRTEAVQQKEMRS